MAVSVPGGNLGSSSRKGQGMNEQPRIIRGAGWTHERGRFAGYSVHQGRDLGLDARARDAIHAEAIVTSARGFSKYEPHIDLFNLLGRRMDRAALRGGGAAPWGDDEEKYALTLDGPRERFYARIRGELDASVERAARSAS